MSAECLKNANQNARANVEKSDKKQRSMKSVEQELMLLEGDHYNFEGLRMLDGELFPENMQDSDVLETVEKRIKELKDMIARGDSMENVERLGEFGGLPDDEENRLNREIEERATSIDEKGFADDLKNIKLKSALIEYLQSLDGKKVGGKKFIAQVHIDAVEKVFNADMTANDVKLKPLREAIKEIRRIELARIGTEFTLGKIANYAELWAETEKEGDEILKSKARELWNFFATHIKSEDKKNNKKYSDLDGKCGLALFKEAGVQFDLEKDVEYVDPGESRLGAVNVDTSGRHGVSVSGDWHEIDSDNMTLYNDHHDKMSGNKTSGTQESYDFLIAMGLLERTEQMDALVDFVTKVDNLTYPGIEKYFENSHKTLAGLERFMQFDGLKNFFKTEKNRKNSYRELTDKEMRLLGIITNKRNRSEEQKKVIDESKSRLEELEREGLIIESEKYERVVIDIGKRVPGGFLAASAFGCGAYVIWSPEKKSFFISTKNPIEENFSQGAKIRQRMWIKPRNNSDELVVTLKEIVEKLSGNKLDKDTMKNILEKEAGEKIISIYRKDAQEAVDSFRKDNPAVAEDVLFEKLGIALERQIESDGIIAKDKIKSTIERLKKEIK